MIYSWNVKRMAERHAESIKELLTTTQGVTIETCAYIAKETFIKAWGRAEDELLPKHGRDGKFIKR